MAFLEWLENTDTMTWIRESTSLLGYTMYLSAHTLGLVFLLGPVIIISLRLTGLAPRIPIAPLRSFVPLMRAGFVVNVLSGLVLFATAPVGFVHNLTFLFKLACVMAAAAVLLKFWRLVFAGADPPDVAIESPEARRLFTVSSVLWIVAITAGRLTAYSAYVIKQTVVAVGVALVASAVVALVVRAALARRESGREMPPLAVPAKGE